MFSASAVQASSNLGVENVFNTFTYTGAGTAPLSISIPSFYFTGSSFQWMKNRTQFTQPHTFGKQGNYLYTNSTNFTFGTPNFISDVAGNVVSFGSNQSYLSGDYYNLFSTLEAPKFFSQTSWSGNNSARTIPHSLGSAPGLVIVKSTSGSVGNWFVWHRGLSANQTVYLNDTSAVATTSMFSSVPDANNLYLASSVQNVSGVTYTAYMWAHNAGGYGSDGSQNIVSCGTYVGNGSTTTGVSVSVGFEPQWILVRNTTVGSNWFLVDTTRGASEVQSYLSFPNLNSVDSLSASASLYPTNSGFIAVDNASWAVNTSGSTYIYLAIRRGPMSVPSDSSQVFSAVLSNNPTGTSMTVGFQPDMQISKARAIVSNTNVVDAYRGAIETLGSTYAGSRALATNSSGGPSNLVITNKWQPTTQAIPSAYNGVSTVYWNFKRAPRFFDLVRYTGTVAATGPMAVNHSLGYTPEMMWVKRIDAAADWAVYHTAVGSINALNMNTSGASSSSQNWWYQVPPTSTQFTVGTNAASTGTYGGEYVAYLFATVPGISSVGSYSGNGSPGKNIDCGFVSTTCKFLIVKRIDGAGDWYVYDSTRGMYFHQVFPSGSYVWPVYTLLNSTAAEVDLTDYVGQYAGGFSLPYWNPGTNPPNYNPINISGASYMYYAIGGQTLNY